MSDRPVFATSRWSGQERGKPKSKPFLVKEKQKHLQLGAGWRLPLVGLESALPAFRVYMGQARVSNQNTN
jgi:hypothetical protein